MRALTLFFCIFSASLMGCQDFDGRSVDVRFENSPDNAAQNEAPADLKGVILPHHNLTGKNIDEFYESIKDDNFERIIILSTNHFDFGYGFIQSSLEARDGINPDKDFIRNLRAGGFLHVEPVTFNAEHGITTHYDRIQKYFPESKVVPIMIKWKTPEENLSKLIKGIGEADDGAKTLIIASIDFSHFVSEETGRENDDRSSEFLLNWADKSAAESDSGGNGISGNTADISLDELLELEKSISFDTEKSTAYDSPEALYVFMYLIVRPEKVEIFKRTSSAEMTGIKDPMQYTSHLFVKVY